MELRGGEIPDKALNFKKMGTGCIRHISAARVDRTGGWGQAQRGVGGQGTWVVFVQSDSVDQELIKAFVDY